MKRPGRRVPVDGRFQCGEERGDSLDLIDREKSLRILCSEPIRVDLGGLAIDSVVEAHHPCVTAADQLLHERGLADLPGTADDRDRCVSERLLDERSRIPPDQAACHALHPRYMLRIYQRFPADFSVLCCGFLNYLLLIFGAATAWYRESAW